MTTYIRTSLVHACAFLAFLAVLSAARADEIDGFPSGAIAVEVRPYDDPPAPDEFFGVAFRTDDLDGIWIEYQLRQGVPYYSDYPNICERRIAPPSGAVEISQPALTRRWLFVTAALDSGETHLFAKRHSPSSYYFIPD